MLFVKPDRNVVSPQEAKKRYGFAMKALTVSVTLVLLAMAAAVLTKDDLGRADYALFAIVLLCLAVLTPVAVHGQRHLLAQAVEAGKDRQG